MVPSGRIIRPCLVFGLLVVAPGCGQGDWANLFWFFGPTVTLVIENNTSYEAVPDFRSGPGRNLVEDVLEDERQITGFGFSGVVGPRQTAEVRVPCNSSLEQIRLVGIKFQNGGIGVGDVDLDEQLRRDIDFDCADTVRVTLTGSLFFFRAAVNVEEAEIGRADSESDDSRDLGSVLDDLFN